MDKSTAVQPAILTVFSLAPAARHIQRQDTGLGEPRITLSSLNNN